MDAVREEGELEDGELSDDEEVMPTLPPVMTSQLVEPVPSESFHSPPVLSAHDNSSYTPPPPIHEYDMPPTVYREPTVTMSDASLSHSTVLDDDKEEGEADDDKGDDDAGSVGNSDDDKRRRHKRHDKKRKRGHTDRKKRRKYHDFDSAPSDRANVGDFNKTDADDPYMRAWPGFGNSNRHPRGSYESHEDREISPATEHPQDQDMRLEQRADPRAHRLQHAYDEPYGSPSREKSYSSPPGPYDSPDDGELDDGRRRPKYPRFGDRSGPRERSQPREGRSLLSMVGDDYMDANVAANEKEEMFDRKTPRNPEKTQRMREKARRYQDRQRQRDRDFNDRDERRRHDRKREICRQYEAGSCPRGDDCQYSHDCVQRPGQRKVLCKHYLRGGCNRDWCVFMHGDYPCKYYYQDRCEMGERCRFAHGDMTNEIRHILERDERDVSPKRLGQIRRPGSDNMFETNKSSLLGEPPKHVKEVSKKIPSIFDIKVEPPKKPTNQNMGPSGPAPGSGFYGDMSHNMPPRMPAPPHAGPGLLGPAPGMPPMQNMNIPPPGYMGLPGPAPNFPPPPTNFFTAPPPPMAMNSDNTEGQMDPSENQMESDKTGNDDNWNKQEKGENWNQNDGSDQAMTSQPSGGQKKIDLNTMLTMIRNSVVGSNSSPQHSSQQVPAARDPRSSGDPRANRADPRSRDTDTPTKAPPSAASPPPSDSGNYQHTEATFGYAKNQEMEAPASPEPERIINCSLAYTGGVPYFLYKISLDVLRPMLPKSVNPSDEKYADDPRVKRYGRIGQAAPVEPKMIRPGRARQASVDSVVDTKPKFLDPKATSTAVAGRSADDILTSPLSVPESKPDDTKAISLPEGLKKPLIPLPKLLDPRLGKQLSMEHDKAKPERTPQKSPTPGSKPAQPFSHRNDPRFRKKAKPRTSSGSMEADSLQQHLSNESAPSNTDSETATEKKPEISDISGKSGDTNVDRENRSSLDDTSAAISSDLLNITHEQFLANEATIKKDPLDPMEYSAPLGYYSEMTNDDTAYDAYSSPRNTPKKESKSNDDLYGSSVSVDPSHSNSVVSDSQTTSYNPAAAIKTESIYSMADPSAEESSYIPIKDMFKTIDPTASPFGSIA